MTIVDSPVPPAPKLSDSEFLALAKRNLTEHGIDPAAVRVPHPLRFAQWGPGMAHRIRVVMHDANPDVHNSGSKWKRIVNAMFNALLRYHLGFSRQPRPRGIDDTGEHHSFAASGPLGLRRKVSGPPEDSVMEEIMGNHDLKRLLIFLRKQTGKPALSEQIVASICTSAGDRRVWRAESIWSVAASYFENGPMHAKLHRKAGRTGDRRLARTGGIPRKPHEGYSGDDIYAHGRRRPGHFNP